MKFSDSELTVILRALKEVSTQQYNRYQVMCQDEAVPALVLQRYEIEVDEYLTVIQAIKNYNSTEKPFEQCRHCDDALSSEDDIYNGLCQSCATRLAASTN